MSDAQVSLFTRIINREIPADIVYEDDQCIVINDIAPQAPVHMLVIPRKPLAMLVDAEPDDKMVMGHLLWVAGEVARLRGVDEAFRLVINNGAGAGQTVFHLHFHVLGNTQFDETNLATF
ncbi:MAG: histidine triad nucleotide-binding protein [Cellvibrionales bacterium]|nr:histidine triad nucleotide-binding protein [Porticoccaceae bacterium]|tara:strand:+ start:6987 stop:7346 length:360 start_codon:yes stop_codon:yes gene_type:complete